MASPSRDLTPVIPKKNRSLFFCLVGLMSITPLIALWPWLSSYTFFSAADPVHSAPAAPSFTLLMGAPEIMLCLLLGVSLVTALSLKKLGIRFTAISGLILSAISILWMIILEYARLNSDILPPLHVYCAHVASIMILSITTFSGIVQIGAQKTCGRRLLTAAMLSPIVPAAFFLTNSLYLFLFNSPATLIIYLIFTLPLMAWLIFRFLTMGNIDLSLDERDIPTSSCTSTSHCIACSVIAFISPVMIYSLSIYFSINLAALILGSSQSNTFINFAPFIILAVTVLLRFFALTVYSKRRKLIVPLALLTGSIIPVKLAEYLPLRSYPILLPSLLVALSMLVWYAMITYAESIMIFVLV